MIHEWIKSRFVGAEPKTFFEIGAHVGTDTAQLAAVPGATVHAFEPDPRNAVPALPNVVFNRAAVGDRDGAAPFYPSRARGDREWTCSGSLFAPTGHLTAYPDVTFGAVIEVPVVTLDAYVRERGIGRIDFIWADTQGAEAALVRGGRAALARTRYLYTEYCDPPLYAGQPTRAELLALLRGWRVLHDWPSGEAYADMLLENTQAA